MKMYDCLLAELFAIMINPISVSIQAPGLYRIHQANADQPEQVFLWIHPEHCGATTR